MIFLLENTTQIRILYRYALRIPYIIGMTYVILIVYLCIFHNRLMNLFASKSEYRKVIT